jgi:hypothetical protein
MIDDRTRSSVGRLRVAEIEATSSFARLDEAELKK